ncbi:MAG TPA: hypothetical protein VGP55_08165 [Chitinophagaceae bacterium]|nr:hypothetical protein [Chitinophagaceae bacterium]
MSADKKVQFVCFETTLDKEPFIKRWEQYTRSLHSNVGVTLQQSEKNGVFRYIAQHRFSSGELQFVFSKEPRTSRLAQVHIKTMQAGGYTILQAERLHDTLGNERKIFVFLTDPNVDLNIYKELFTPVKLNIYEAYYENCKYSYILEYFVKTKDAPALLEKLNLYDSVEDGTYKECTLAKTLKNNKEKDLYVWPTV